MLPVENYKKLGSLVCIKVKSIALKVKQVMPRDGAGRRFDEALGTPMPHIESGLAEFCCP